MIVSGIQRNVYQEKESQVGKASNNDSVSFGGLVKEAAQTVGVEEVDNSNVPPQQIPSQYIKLFL